MPSSLFARTISCLSVFLSLSSAILLPKAHKVTTSRVSSLFASKKGRGETYLPARNERVPWDALRFFRQSSKFVTLPNLLRRGGGGRTIFVEPGDCLWEPASRNNTFRFSPLDDVVMGGASESTIDHETGIWTGTVTSANDGGFIGIRSTPFASPLDMSACSGIEVRSKGGDGKRFKVVIRDSTDFNGVCWTTSFDSPSSLPKDSSRERGTNSLGTVRLPFEGQIPCIFARTVPDQVFKRNRVLGFQFAYSKFEYDGALNPKFSLGRVSLQILGLYAY